MKKSVTSIVVFLLVISGAYAATSVSIPVSVDADSTGWTPYVFMDTDTRLMLTTEPGRTELIQRHGNYAFEGEQIRWDVLVWDRNGIQDVVSVHSGLGPAEGPESKNAEAECTYSSRTSNPSNNGAVDEAGHPLAFNPATMRWYTCIFTVEPGDADSETGMYGEYFLAVDAEDQQGNIGSFVEEEFFFFNPTISVDVMGRFDFGTVTPGVPAYSKTVIVKNAASDDSGVKVNFFISGSDFYDSASSHAACGNSNVLSLGNFRYFASSGNTDSNGNVGADIQGYDSIPYETGNPGNRKQLIGENTGISEGGDVPIKLKLNMPSPCSGNFNSGSIYIFAQAI